MDKKPSQGRIEDRLTSLFSSTYLGGQARDREVLIRDNKVKMPPLVWSFVFGFATGERRTLAEFRRTYNRTADEPVSPGGFYQRLTPELATYFRDLVEYALDEVTAPATVSDQFDRFTEVTIADATVLRLHRFLSDEYQATHEDQAGAQLHLVHNVSEQVPDRISITDERTHESTEFETGPWLEDRLVLFDLAYFKYRRFALIDENDGFFVIPLKANANPTIVEELDEWRGNAIPLEGKRIQDVIGDLQRKDIDVEVEASFKRGQYNGTRSQDTKRFRVVGVRDEDADYDLYITNLPVETFSPENIATLYRCRWEVELLFRELQSRYELDEFQTSKSHIVELLIYASILTLLVSREILSLVRSHAADPDAMFPPERWATTFRSFAPLILDRLRAYLGYSPLPLLDLLCLEARKIHQSRSILIERLAEVMPATSTATAAA